MRVAFTWSRVEVFTRFNLDQRIVDHLSSFTGTALSFHRNFSAADCNIMYDNIYPSLFFLEG
jgi:hypothetical protein